MNKNPWSLERLQSYIGEEESYQLEFKSSRDLLQQNPNKFFDELSRDVSAFLNSEGGTLIIGIEEATRKDEKRAGKAVDLSEGVPRSQCRGDRLSNAICDRIHPSVSSYVQVYPVTIGQRVGEDLLAFVVKVVRGITAYQAADKRYYARRSFSIDAMDDKDIRLRILADDKPRGQIFTGITWMPHGRNVEHFRREAEPFRSTTNELLSLRGSKDAFTDNDHGRLFALHPSRDLTITVRLMLRNIGSVTIREGAVEAGLDISDMGSAIVSSKPQPLERFSFDSSSEDPIPALYPDMERGIAEWNILVREQWKMGIGTVLLKGVSVYLDNGPSVVRDENFDLTEDFRTAVNAGWAELARITSS